MREKSTWHEQTPSVNNLFCGGGGGHNSAYQGCHAHIKDVKDVMPLNGVSSPLF